MAGGHQIISKVEDKLKQPDNHHFSPALYYRFTPAVENGNCVKLRHELYCKLQTGNIRTRITEERKYKNTMKEIHL